MKRAILLGAICILVWTSSIALGQELTTEVFPSEDELLEALIAGEIDYDLYILLLEIPQHGVDSTNAYLLDLIPNLSSLSDHADTEGLASEQQELFVAGNTARPSRLRYSYYRTVDEEEQSRYRIDSRMRLTDQWTADIAVRKELSGQERIIRRSLRYKCSDKVVRELAIGSITERYGLGAVIGYRGKLLHFSDMLDRESFRYPDNGGFNGIAVTLRKNIWQLRSLVSQLRDSANDIRTLAGTIERANGAIRPFVVAGITRVRNRGNDRSFDDLKLSGGLVHKYKKGSISVEYCRQMDKGRHSDVLLAEGTHKLPRNRIEYAGWWYGNDYVDLTGGGRAVDIRTGTELPGPDFTLRSKRPGQRGLHVKGKTELDDRTQLHSVVVYARRNIDTSNLQWLVGVERELSKRLTVRLDYLHNLRERAEADSNNDVFTRRCRVEARYNTDQMRIRSYVAFSSTSSYGDYVSMFASVRLHINPLTHADLWSNLSRLAKGNVQYWYIYGKLSQQLTAAHSLAIKLMHRFDRRASLQNSNAVSLEWEATW